MGTFNSGLTFVCVCTKHCTTALSGKEFLPHALFVLLHFYILRSEAGFYKSAGKHLFSASVYHLHVWSTLFLGYGFNETSKRKNFLDGETNPLAAIFRSLKLLIETAAVT